ncbi:MAG TPA: F0F1 ATP synthase subunit A [Longimicrobium sp.]|jgi:F-type H+-transporting ATPase subunit a|uniref:F0F1 ATP synthase subunit A n=1 Tax=Longimicrobium sp. TaxID=2029185 RepID=UPI002ED90B4E
MKLNAALLALLFAAAPAVAQASHGTIEGPEVPSATPPQAAQAVHQAATGDGPGHAAAEGEHGETAGGHGEFDAMHHVQDGHTLDFQPFGEIHLPAAHSWQVGPLDMTPTRHVVFMVLASLIMLAVFIPAGRAAARRQAGHGHAKKRHNAIEAAALFIRQEVVMPNIGHGGEKFAGFLITLFFFILFCNLLGLLPFGATATANFAVTIGLALITFVVVEVTGMITLGPKGYLQTIVFIPHGLPKALVPVMAVIMTPVELLGKFAKPFALSVRLMANMMAGHIVLLSLFSMALMFGGALMAGPFVMATALMFLELFVAFLQAYVFVVLSSVFIGLMRHAH